MAKAKFVSTNEEVTARAKEWLSNNISLTNEEVVLWISQYYGDSFVKGISRTKYTAKVIVRGEEGEHEVIVSLPRKMVSQ